MRIVDIIETPAQTSSSHSLLAQPRPKTLLQIIREIQSQSIPPSLHNAPQLLRVPEASQAIVSPLIPCVSAGVKSTHSVDHSIEVLLTGVAGQESIPRDGVGFQTLAAHVGQDLLGELELAVAGEAFEEDGPGLDVRGNSQRLRSGGSILHVLDYLGGIDEGALVLRESAEESVVAVS